MKFIKYFFLLSFLFCTFLLQAQQAPGGINYQAVLRDQQGQIIAGKPIDLRIAITSPEGQEVFYEETHSITTSNAGMFSLVIGEGKPTIKGAFKDIPWAGTNTWLEVAYDLENDGIYEITGNTRLLSVPYALYAEKSGSVVGSGANDNDPTYDGPDGPTNLDWWGLKGNEEVDESYMYLGSQNYADLVFKTNSIERFRITKDGVLDFGLAPAVFVGSVILENTLLVKGDAVFQSNIEVEGNVAILQDFKVEGHTDLHTLYVKEDAHFGNDVDIDRNLNIDFDVHIGQDLDVDRDANIDRNVHVGNDVDIDNNLNVDVDVHIGQDLDVDRDANIDRNLHVGNDADIDNNLNVDVDVHIGQDLDVDRDANIDRNVHVGNDVDIDNNLNVDVDVHIGQNLDVDNDANIDNDLHVGRDADVDRNLNVDVDAHIGQNLDVDNNANVDVDLHVGRDADVDRNLNVDMNTHIGQDLDVDRDANIDRNLNVDVDAHIGNNLDVDNNANVDVDLHVGRDADVDRNLNVDVNAHVGQDLDVDRDVNIDRNLNVDFNATVGQDLTVAGDLKANCRLVVNSCVSGSDSDPDSYPVHVSGSNQGVYIQVNGSRSNANNFVTFADGSGIQGRIEGQTLTELQNSSEYLRATKIFNLEIAALSADVAGLTAEALTVSLQLFTIAEAVSVTAQATAAAIKLAAYIIERDGYLSDVEGNVGVAYESGSGDYAEWLERSNPESDLQFGQIVGVRGGKISLDTRQADHYMVVSKSPIVLGNMPQPADEPNFEKVAFMGQVPVQVVGKVAVGDYIIPSGNNDGYGIAVDPARMKLGDYARIVGVAWTDAPDGPLHYVNVAVGINTNDLSGRMEQQQRQIDQLNQQVSQMMAYLQGKATLPAGDVAAVQPATPTPEAISSPSEQTSLRMSYSTEEFDRIMDLNAEVLKEFYTVLEANLRAQGVNPDDYPELEKYFTDPLEALKDLRRDPSLKTFWSRYDQKLKEKSKH